MAPTKFGLLKSRSREQPDQPPATTITPTGDMVQISFVGQRVMVEVTKVLQPSTSQAGDELLGSVDSDQLPLGSGSEDVIPDKQAPSRRASEGSKVEGSQINYHLLKNQSSTDATSTSTLHDDDSEHIELDRETTLALDDLDGASTSCDANSIQFDETSIAPSEDTSVYCGTLKKPKKSRSKEEKLLRDFDMWQATNVEVMQNLLSRSGTVDDQIKWEAIATARGLCTLTDSCTCKDCNRTKCHAAGIADGDGGLGSAPLFSAISVGCNLQ